MFSDVVLVRLDFGVQAAVDKTGSFALCKGVDLNTCCEFDWLVLLMKLYRVGGLLTIHAEFEIGKGLGFLPLHGY